MAIDNSSTAVTAHKRPTFADIEKRMGELLTQAGLHSRNSDSAASPDSPPTRARPTPEPHPGLPQPTAELQPGETGLHGLGNISSSSIDQALEKLSSLGAATGRFTGAGRSRPATLWSAIGHEYAEPIEEETPEGFLSRRISALVRTF